MKCLHGNSLQFCWDLDFLIFVVNQQKKTNFERLYLKPGSSTKQQLFNGYRKSIRVALETP